MEVKKVMDDMLNKIAGKEELDKEDELEQRLRKLEVKEVMNDLLNKVAVNYVDTKFEKSILDVVGSISTYVGSVNTTSSEQYQDFNKNLKESFGYNL